MEKPSLELYEKLFTASEKELEKRYFDFLRFASISAEIEKRPELKACASWLEKWLKEAGFQVEVWNKEDAPVLFAENSQAGKEYPTLLIYNHYDVQPVDPIELWESPPFTPTRKGNQIVARGAQDNKGQCFFVVSALHALYNKFGKELGKLPINIKLLIEGEEESGSKSLPRVIQQEKNKLKADYLLIVDVGMRKPTKPAITLGTRGLVSFTVDVTSSHSDLHSGLYGGIVYNPLHALVEILDSLHDANGRVAIPGFYDSVAVPRQDELKCLSLTLDEKEFIEEVGCAPVGGEKGFSPLERGWLRPTLEINGISGGYGGPGSKTVIPAKALAKLSCRLVPDQEPDMIAKRVKQFIEAKAPHGVKVQCTIHEGMGKAVRSSPHCKVVKALSNACEKVYKTEPEYILDGATIPIVSELAQISGAEVAYFGLGLATDKIHAPNEYFGWDRIKNGYLIMCEALSTLAKM